MIIVVWLPMQVPVQVLMGYGDTRGYKATSPSFTESNLYIKIQAVTQRHCLSLGKCHPWEKISWLCGGHGCLQHSLQSRQRDVCILRLCWGVLEGVALGGTQLSAQGFSECSVFFTLIMVKINIKILILYTVRRSDDHVCSGNL